MKALILGVTGQDGSYLAELLLSKGYVVELMAQASVEAPMVNVGSGREICIRDLAIVIAQVVGYDGDIAFDSAKPSGAPRKVLDCSLATRLGWRARTPLREGLERTYAEMCA